MYFRRLEEVPESSLIFEMFLQSLGIKTSKPCDDLNEFGFSAILALHFVHVMHVHICDGHLVDLVGQLLQPVLLTKDGNNRIRVAMSHFELLFEVSYLFHMGEL